MNMGGGGVVVASCTTAPSQATGLPPSCARAITRPRVIAAAPSVAPPLPRLVVAPLLSLLSYHTPLFHPTLPRRASSIPLPAASGAHCLTPTHTYYYCICCCCCCSVCCCCSCRCGSSCVDAAWFVKPRTHPPLRSAPAAATSSAAHTHARGRGGSSIAEAG